MKKGVILSMDKHFLTLLTPEGEFHRSKKQEDLYEIGTEIYFAPYVKEKPKSLLFWYTRPALVSAMVMVLLIFSLIPSLFNEKVSAYVTIDINPSIELSLNENLRVVGLSGFNKEGQMVIERINKWKYIDVEMMTTMIVKATKELGYANTNKQILVSATLLKSDKVLTKKLNKKLRDISQQNVVPEADVKIIKATVQERSKAKEQGISTGTYIENKKKQERKKNKKHNLEQPKINEHNKKSEPSLLIEKVKMRTVEPRIEAVPSTSQINDESKSTNVKVTKTNALAKPKVSKEPVKSEQNKKQKQELRQKQPKDLQQNMNKQMNKENNIDPENENKRENKQTHINNHNMQQKHKEGNNNDENNKRMKRELKGKERGQDEEGNQNKHEH